MGKQRRPGGHDQGMTRQVSQQITAQTFSGPLPPADHFAAYDQVVPGTGKRLIEMAEREQTHRHGSDAKQLQLDRDRLVVESETARDLVAQSRLSIESEIAARARGQIMGGLIAAGVCIGGFATIYAGKETVGAVTIIGGLGSIALSFFLGKRERAAPRVKKEFANGNGKNGEHKK